MRRKPIIEELSIFVGLILLILTSGCVSIGPTVKTYSGDNLQKSDVAVIKGYWLFVLLGYGGIDIYSIDDAILEATKAEVLPGMHDLVIRWYSFSFVAPIGAPPRTARLEFNFEAGHEYKIKAHFQGITQEGADIIDVTTGAIVARLWYWAPGEREQLERRIRN